MSTLSENQDGYQPVQPKLPETSRSRSTGLLANTFGGQVHTKSDEQRLAHCLQTAENISVYKRYREYGNEIQGKEGASLLDIGCGIGDTCRKLAKRVGSDGRVVGIDASYERLKRARRLTEQTGIAGAEIEWVWGTADRLPFPDGQFDGARVERTLQHVANVPQVLGEVKRILKPGGTLVAVDPDWREFSIESPFTDADTTEAILAFWKDSFACGDIVERMPQWLNEAGFRRVETKTFWLDYDHSFHLAEILFDLTRLAPAAVDAGVVSGRQSRAWLKSLREADNSGLLRWKMPLCLFLARS